MMTIKIKDGELQGKMGSSRVVEDEGWREEGGKECHVSLGRQVPAGEAKAFALCGDRGNRDTPHFPPFPCLRHAHVGGVTRVTNFKDAPIGCFFDSEGENGGESMFQCNSGRGIFPSVLSSQGKKRKQHKEQRAKESYAIAKGARGRQRG